MSKSKEAPVKVECMGGCGKYQMIRRSKMNQSLQFVGCMNCEGCRRAEDFARANRAEGTHLEIHVPGHAGVGDLASGGEGFPPLNTRPPLLAPEPSVMLALRFLGSSRCSSSAPTSTGLSHRRIRRRQWASGLARAGTNTITPLSGDNTNTATTDSLSPTFRRRRN